MAPSKTAKKTQAPPKAPPNAPQNPDNKHVILVQEPGSPFPAHIKDSMRKGGLETSDFTGELTKLGDLSRADASYALLRVDHLIERLIADKTYQLLDACEPRNKFLENYFRIVDELFSLPFAGFFLLSASRPWATFNLTTNVSRKFIDSIVDEVTQGVTLTNELALSTSGKEPSESGSKLIYETVLVRQEGTTIGALVFGTENKSGFDYVFKQGMHHLEHHIHPIMRLILANQELEVLYQREQYRTSTDPLTGLYNLEFLVGFLQQQLLFSYRQRSPVTLLMIDIDHLKQVNDAFGYEVGDLVVSTISNRLLTMTRSSDLIARYGGGSYAIVMPNTDLNGARVVAEKVRLEVQHMSYVRGGGRKGPHVTVSVGCACFNMEDLNPETILRDSKLALQKAKRHGGNKVELSQAE